MVIKIKNVSKSFTVKNKHIDAVKNVSLEIYDDEIFGIVGYSGAGKSTLVRLVNGLEKVDSGEITQEEFYTLLDKVKKDLTNN